MKPQGLLPCAVSMFILQLVSGNMTFSQEPTDVEVDVGGFVLLPCVLAEDRLPENHHMVWTHNGTPILEDTNPLEGLTNVRYRGMGMDVVSNIAIQDAVREDHGSYFTCEVYNGNVAQGNATLVLRSRSAKVTVRYPPNSKYPLCRVQPTEAEDQVDVVLSCCTEVVSVPLSIAWTAQGANASWRVTPLAATGYEKGESCSTLNIHSGFNFSSYQCELEDAFGQLNNFERDPCKVEKVSPTGISLKFLDHRSAQFTCTVDMPGRFSFLWHLLDEDKLSVEQVSLLNTEPSLVLQLNRVSNGSYLSCSIFEKVEGSSMGSTELKIVLQAQPPGHSTPTMLIIGVVIGGVVATLIIGLSTYFIMVRCAARNERYYASLERGSEPGMQIGPGNTYIYHQSGENGSANGRVVTVEGGVLETDADEIPPKPGGHRTISWEPEDIVIRSNGGVINHSGDPKRRNVEGLVYADLAFQEGEEEQDAETEGEQEEALRGAVGGETNGTKPGQAARQNSIEYASIVPPLRSLRF